jgi:hypothetical protein
MDINISSDHNPCTLRSEKARTKKKQQLLQHTNPQGQDSEWPEGTALLPGQQFHCHPVQIVIGSAARAHLTRAGTTSHARTAATKHAQKETSAAAAAQKLTRFSIEIPEGNCTPCKATI